MCLLEEVYRKILQRLQIGDYQSAERLSLYELGKLQEGDPRLLFYLGTAARMQNRPKAAMVAFDAALVLEPENVDYIQALASTAEAVKDYVRAYELMKRAVRLDPSSADILANYGVSLERVSLLDEAAHAYGRAIAINPKQGVANMNYGSLLHKLGRKKEALTHNRLAHQRLPERIATLYNLVDTLIANFQYEEALNYCETGLAWQPRHSHLMIKMAIALSGLSRCDEALAVCSEARLINPSVVTDLLPLTRNLPRNVGVFMNGHIIEYEGRYAEQSSCFWENRARYVSKLKADINGDIYKNRALEGCENGFKVLSLELGAQERLALMQNIADYVKNNAWLMQSERFEYSSNNKKLRIGYLSPDLRQHPTAILSRQLFSIHDKNKFEIYAYSLVDKHDYYRNFIEESCDSFYNVSNFNAYKIAQLINQNQIDILVDLAGYTTHSRAEVMAMRPAPVQFQYLGFGATTMGADFIDYVLIDKQLCLDGREDEFTEQAIRLPHTIYPYDNEIDHSETTYKRTDFDLPEDTFVFCCLNNSYKIEPVIFDCWMNILKAVPNSVLWLLGKGSDVQDNLEREAEKRGIDRSRLVFTGRVPLEQHLPRYQLADLFLDTYWHNAHTTAAEALWQGLPLITIMGEVPSARGAASILTALEMPELIVQNHDDYEQLAIYYATHPEEYAAMREKLKAKRYTAPMYNTKLTVKHIEKAYLMAWERYQQGLPPAAFDVPENTDPELRKSIH